MSILIKGMKMPKNCCECFAFKTDGNGWLFCMAGGIVFGAKDAYLLPLRPSDHCPLLEVPDHAVICGTMTNGTPVMMFIQPESKEEKDEHID